MSAAMRPEPLPPVIELGRALGALEAEYWRLDEASVSSSTGRLSERMTLVDLRQDALRLLISTMPAVTLADAAVQLGVAHHWSSTVSDSDWSSEAGRRELERRHEIVCRLMTSALPIVAKAAGLDMTAMGWEDVLRDRAPMVAGEAPA